MNLNQIKVGKFDILATFTYTKQLGSGATKERAKEYGMVVAICGARGGGGGRRGGGSNFEVLKAAAGKKKKGGTITADMFDRQVARKFGDFFETFVGGMEDFIDRGMTYDQIKEAVAIPSTRGAKITLEQFLSV